MQKENSSLMVPFQSLVNYFDSDRLPQYAMRYYSRCTNGIFFIGGAAMHSLCHWHHAFCNLKGHNELISFYVQWPKKLFTFHKIDDPLREKAMFICESHSTLDANMHIVTKN